MENGVIVPGEGDRMQKWEYKVLYCDSREELQRDLNLYGDVGWEAVTSQSGNSWEFVVVLKRPKA